MALETSYKNLFYCQNDKNKTYYLLKIQFNSLNQLI